MSWPALPAPTISYTDSAADAADTSAYRFSGRAIGAAARDRIVVVVVAAAVRDDDADGVSNRF